MNYKTSLAKDRIILTANMLEHADTDMRKLIARYIVDLEMMLEYMGDYTHLSDEEDDE